MKRNLSANRLTTDFTDKSELSASVTIREIRGSFLQRIHTGNWINARSVAYVIPKVRPRISRMARIRVTCRHPWQSVKSVVHFFRGFVQVIGSMHDSLPLEGGLLEVQQKRHLQA